MPYIPPVTTAPATPENWGASNATAPKSATELDKDTFLKLLVAQLKYQDPLSPADPQQFLAQTAQFTSVEKLEQIATQTADQTWAIALNTASTLVGKEVTFLRTDGTTGTGIATSALTEPDGIILNVGDEQVPLGAITTITPVAATPPAATPPAAAPSDTESSTTDSSTAPANAI
jgi:flagellar basal-body rod modification protein FlgD